MRICSLIWKLERYFIVTEDIFNGLPSLEL